MNYEAMIEETELAAREASGAPWRAQGRLVLDARGNVVAEARAADVAQAVRDARAIAQSLSLLAGDVRLAEQLRSAEESADREAARAADAESRLSNVEYDLDDVAGERDHAKRDLREAEATVEKLRAQLRDAGMDPAA